MALSKSQVSALVKSLESCNLIRRSGELCCPAQGLGRPQLLLEICPERGYCALLINMLADCLLYVFSYGDCKLQACLRLEHSDSVADLAQRVRESLLSWCEERHCSLSDFLVLLAAEQVVVEQGFDSVVVKDKVLDDVNCELSAVFRSELGFPCYVCNLAWGHLRAILEKVDPPPRDGIFFMCGEGSVGFGLVMHGQIVLGSHGTFPECAHLSYEHGFERSLGNYGPHTADALYFAISELSPVFMISSITVSGICFEGHTEVIDEVRARFASHPNPFLSGLEINYVPMTAAERLTELARLSFDLAVELINPQQLRRSLTAMLPGKVD